MAGIAVLIRNGSNSQADFINVPAIMTQPLKIDSTQQRYMSRFIINGEPGVLVRFNASDINNNIVTQSGNPLPREAFSASDNFMHSSMNALGNNVTQDNDNLMQNVVTQETEEEIASRINERFEVLNDLTWGIVSGKLRTIIVSGAPGVGKSESITRILEDASTDPEHDIEYNIVKGKITSDFQLYKLLYDNSGKNNVLVLDDNDGILYDANCINLLKAACEGGKRDRKISYFSQKLEQQDIPTSFVYEGRIIFITNVNFQKIIDRDKNDTAKHLSALINRGLYLDLMLHSGREILCRIKDMVLNHNMLEFANTDEKKAVVVNWISENWQNLSTMSLRTAIMLDEMIENNPNSWERTARVTLLKNRKS